jgi:SAM-dependent methyltransferase
VSRWLDRLRRFHDLDIRLTDRVLSGTPFYAGFWVKCRIQQHIARRADLARGVLLDLGCGRKPYQAIFAPHVTRHLGIEYAPESGYRGNTADLCGDAAAIPLRAASVDTVLCTEVLEHVPDPERVVREIARVLRPGGVVFCTAPFFYPIHGVEDYYRYGPEGVAAILKRQGFEVESIQPLSGSGLTLAILFNLYWFEIGFLWTKWLYPLGLVLRPLLHVLCMIINIAGWFAERLLPSKHMAYNHLTIARRK